MAIYEQNLEYEEALREDIERDFQRQLKLIEEIERKEKEEKEKEEIEKEKEEERKPTKEELRNLRMKFYIGNNNDKNTK